MYSFRRDSKHELQNLKSENLKNKVTRHKLHERLCSSDEHDSPGRLHHVHDSPIPCSGCMA